MILLLYLLSAVGKTVLCYIHGMGFPISPQLQRAFPSERSATPSPSAQQDPLFIKSPNGSGSEYEMPSSVLKMLVTSNVAGGESSPASSCRAHLSQTLRLAISLWFVQGSSERRGK